MANMAANMIMVSRSPEWYSSASAASKSSGPTIAAVAEAALKTAIMVDFFVCSAVLTRIQDTTRLVQSESSSQQTSWVSELDLAAVCKARRDLMPVAR